MKVAVSACLLGRPCRYDGKSKPCEAVRAFVEDLDVVPVCPEVMGRLSIPHPPSEIQTKEPNLVVRDSTGKDTTEFFVRGAENALEKALSNNVTHAILKAKSPSCGVGEIYDGTFSKTLVKGDGIATRLFKDAGICVATEKTFEEVFGL